MSTLSLHSMIHSEDAMLAKMQRMQVNTSPLFSVSSQPLDLDVKAGDAASPISFSQAMTNVLDLVNSHQSEASQKVTAVELGQSDDLVGAMVASKKASLSFNALMQVRNKVVSSIDDIMKMPV